ncbi:hypothetical protein [Nonomuraea sp. NPDC050691]|uniref:hypothetical protein n=1 Tax=Nonomuraea sp. NPDC050691 TaxID=3155661 RepID=UPI0033F1972B
MAATFAVTAAAIMRTRVLPVWMAWFAIVVAALKLLTALVREHLPVPAAGARPVMGH